MEILCHECGHSINRHMPQQYNSDAGCHTMVDSSVGLSCDCFLLPQDIATAHAAALQARLELVEAKAREYMEVSTFERGIFGCIDCDIDFTEPSKHLHNCEWRIKHDALLAALNAGAGGEVDG